MVICDACHLWLHWLGYMTVPKTVQTGIMSPLAFVYSSHSNKFVWYVHYILVQSMHYGSQVYCVSILYNPGSTNVSLVLKSDKNSAPQEKPNLLTPL